MRVSALIRLLRPHQWLKNLILFFPPFLGGTMLRSEDWSHGLTAFGAFCLASSATYIVNDIRDRESDRRHPRKSCRPLASKSISVPTSLVLVGVLLSCALILSWSLQTLFAVWLIAYLLLNFAYSFGLKDQPVFDIFCIASGFVFRLFAGGAAFGIRVSDWLFLTVLLLALFLSCGKRLSEKYLLGSESVDHRKSLDGYPDGTLEGLMYLTGAAVLVTYTLYVISKHQLVYSVPLCCFGLFRYILLVKRGSSGDPTDTLVKDPVMFMVGLVWVGIVGVAIYLR